MSPHVHKGMCATALFAGGHRCLALGDGEVCTQGRAVVRAPDSMEHSHTTGLQSMELRGKAKA